MYFDFNLKGLEPITGFITWKLPILPRVGEFIYAPLSFLPEDIIEKFTQTPAIQFVSESYYDSYGEDKEWYSQETFYDYLANYSGNRFQVIEIEWLEDVNIGVYPLLYIKEYE